MKSIIAAISFVMLSFLAPCAHDGLVANDDIGPIDTQEDEALPPTISLACFAELRQRISWGDETINLTHWCRDHAANRGKPLHYNTAHQYMRFQSIIENVKNDDPNTYERVEKVVLELSHGGKIVATWNWTTANPADFDVNGGNTWTVKFPKSFQIFSQPEAEQRGSYSAKVSADVILIKQKEDPKIWKRRTLTASTQFTIVEFDTLIAGTVAVNDDTVQIRDDVCQHNFFESLNIRLKAPGHSGVVDGVIVSTTDRAPFVNGAEVAVGPAPATVVTKNFAAPGSPSSSASLRIHGKSKSVALNDEIYNLTMVGDPCENKPAAKKEATVFWFECQGLTGAPGGAYVFKAASATSSGRFNSPTGSSVTVKSVAAVRPLAIANAPQVANHVTGVLQVCDKYNYKIVYHSPRAPVGATRGASATVASTIISEWSPMPPKLLDTVGRKPLYPFTTSGPERVAPIPLGTGSVQITDNPGFSSTSRGKTISIPTGNPNLPFVIYSVRIEFKFNFTSWCIVMKDLPGDNPDVYPLAHLTWTLDANSDNSPGDKVVIGATVNPTSLKPLVNGQTANERLASPANSPVNSNGNSVIVVAP